MKPFLWPCLAEAVQRSRCPRGEGCANGATPDDAQGAGDQFCINGLQHRWRQGQACLFAGAPHGRSHAPALHHQAPHKGTREARMIETCECRRNRGQDGEGQLRCRSGVAPAAKAEASRATLSYCRASWPQTRSHNSYTAGSAML